MSVLAGSSPVLERTGGGESLVWAPDLSFSKQYCMSTVRIHVHLDDALNDIESMYAITREDMCEAASAKVQLRTPTSATYFTCASREPPQESPHAAGCADALT